MSKSDDEQRILFDENVIHVEVSLQDRGGKEQRVTLRTSLPGFPPLVAVADNPDITGALSEATRELIRQIEHQKSAREPMNNRRLRRGTIRRPDTSWDSEGVQREAADGKRRSASGGAEGLSQTPTPLGR